MKHGRGLKQDRKLKREEQRGEETPILAKSSKILMARGSGVAAVSELPNSLQMKGSLIWIGFINRNSPQGQSRGGGGGDTGKTLSSGIIKTLLYSSG